SAAAPNSIATTASEISSDAYGPIMCTPRMRSVRASASIFTKPTVSPLARAVFGALALEFLFSLAHPGNLRCGIDHPRHRLQIHMSGLARDHLGYRHPLFRGLVREHRTAHYVADRVDVGQIGAAVIIDFDEAAAIQLETDAFGAEVRRH